MPPGGDFLYAEEGRGRAARAKPRPLQLLSQPHPDDPPGSWKWDHLDEDIEKRRHKERSLDEAYRYGLQGPLALELPVLLEAIRGMLGRGEMMKLEDQIAMKDKAQGDFVGAYDKVEAMERDPENVEIRRMIAESGGMMRPAVRDRLVHQMLRAKEREGMLWDKLKETEERMLKTPTPPLAYRQYGEGHTGNPYTYRSRLYEPYGNRPASATYHYPWREE